VYNWNNGTLRKKNWAGNYYSEYKFRNTTWYGFFEQYIAPAAIDKLVLNSPVTEINYSGDKVLVSNVHGDTFEADRVLVTVPIKILQEGSIAFSPNLPSQKTSAIQSVTMPDGLKVFIEFSERFYRDILFTGGLLSEVASSDKLYYDAAFGKDSDQHILGLFTVGEKASAYTALETDEKIIEFILSELDTIFDGKASEVYVKHIVQNWSKAPFIRGSYSYDFANDQETTVADLLAPVQNKLFFAGEALSLDNGSTVPGAAESAYAVVETMLKG
jgi:monoamine oxidase